MRKATLLAVIAALATKTIISCGGPSEKTGNDQPKKDSVVAKTEKDSVVAPAVEKPQTVEERIQEIKQWYAEVNKLGMKNCAEKKRVRKEGPPGQTIAFDQVLKTCKLNDVYELIRGEFSGYEWSYSINIYKKNGKIFFVLYEGSEAALAGESRYYCDKDENLIRQLDREAFDGAAFSGPGKETKPDPLKPKIQDNIKKYQKDIDFVMAKK